MGNLKGFLWSMGRCATKAVSETISHMTETEATSWVDTPKIVAAPNYYLHTYPTPFVLTLHHPQFCDAFAKLVAAHRSIPTVFTVRDPVANLESYANTFLTTFVARRVDEAVKIKEKGQSVSAGINPQAIEQWLMPTANLWKQYNAVKDSPYLLIDFSELSQAHFAETMARICNFYRLEIKTPAVWTGEANTASDRFLIGYLRTFRLVDRSLDLRFTRWDDYWDESGLVSLGTLRSARLRALTGDDGPLHVHARADQLLTEGRIERERQAFARLLAEPALSDAMAMQIVSDFERTVEIVAQELPGLQAAVVRQFMKTSRDGVRRLLKEHPALEDHWDRWRACMVKSAA
jgi:hypothetical protein